jgi:predicted AlkP superfamily phosphohydrolase/phosphomutase
VATGKNPARHGILGWVTRDAEGSIRLYGGQDRRGHALWNIVSDAGLEVGVVNWLNTYPPERIRGVMVSDHALPGEAQGRRNLGEIFARNRYGEPLSESGPLEEPGPVVFPPVWAARLAGLVSDPGPFREELLQDDESRLRWVTGTNLSRDQEIAEIAVAIDVELRPDLLMVLLQGIDRVSHVLWASVEPEDLYPKDQRLSPSQRQSWRQALHHYYEQTDVLIGALVERFGPDDLVLVVSDHGFEAVVGQVGTGGHDSPNAQEGVLFGRGPGVPSGEPAGQVSVNDVTPTILAWLGLPRAADMDGRPAAFLRVAPRDTIETYDTTPIERVTDAPSGAEGDILRQLRSLGYVE